MATLTSTAAASGVAPRAVHAGVNSITVDYNSSGTTISPSATTVLMAKIPSKATILDIVEYHTSGAATCPTDIGVDTSLSALATALTTGTVARASRGIPYRVDASGTVAAGYQYVKCTFTPGTAATSVKSSLTILYTMDE